MAASTAEIVAVSFGTLLIAATVYSIFFNNTNKLPYPPGPKGIPFLGNALDLPREKEWETYSDWARKYGRVTSATALGLRMILVNDVELEQEVFENRGAIYSGRHVPAMMPLMGLDWIVGLMKPDAEWRRCRRLMVRHFWETEIPNYEPTQQRSVHILLHHFLERPDNFMKDIHRFQTTSMLAVVYGHQVPADEDDEMLTMHYAALELNTNAMAAEHIVNLFPIFRHFPTWFPGMRFHEVAAESRPLSKKVLNNPTDAIKEDSSKFMPSFVSRVLDEESASDNTIKSSAATSFNAGVDTSRAMLTSFMLCMTLYPEVQRKGQEEIDRVTGGDRLPLFTDKEQLPYIGAIIKECYRYHPIDPFGLPHKLTDDDILEGYFMPKGSIVTSNVWHIAHDENRYTEPHTFMPERYLGENPEPYIEIFGYGRRVCPGKFIAESSLWMAVMSILAVFNIEHEIGPNGDRIPPKAEYCSGVLSEPLPFKCTIKPRSSTHDALIREAQLDL